MQNPIPNPATMVAARGRLAEILKALLFPSRCQICGRLFHPPAPANPRNGVQRAAGSAGRFRCRTEPSFETVMAPYACGDCRRAFTPCREPFCPVCGENFPSRQAENHLCDRCSRFRRPFRMARAAGIYDRSLKTAIHRLKYGEAIQLARPLGRLLLSCFHRHWHRDPVHMVVPVPLHSRRFRKRGFNQSYLMIRTWSDTGTGPSPLPGGARICRRVLKRARRTRPQTGLDRKRRRKNVADAFCLAGDARVAGRRILLVDDVLTTGATAEACARVLMGAGAACVDVLTLARAP